jgi:hypothetical protein
MSYTTIGFQGEISSAGLYVLIQGEFERKLFIARAGIAQLV